MESHILLVGGSPPGVETLKNLVLPGIGKITVLDGEKVTKRDTGNNFFTPHDTVGQNRAEVLVKYLIEMNADVKGAAVVK